MKKGKILALLLSAALLSGTGTAAFAAEPPAPPEGAFPGEAPGAPGAPPGGSSSSDVSWSGATLFEAAASESGGSYSSETPDENAILINTSEEVALSDFKVEKSGDSDGGDNSSFYGTNSAVMVKGGGRALISGGSVSTAATGANAVFSYGGNGAQNGASGDGTTVEISDVTIRTSGNGSGGIMTTGGGITNAKNLDIETSGGSSAAIRTDRGGGTVTVDGGSYITSGLGSPAIYSTADVRVSNAYLESKLSEGVCIEGKNSVSLENCTLTASNTEMNGNAMFLDAVMLYQSMSGDADSGVTEFTMKGGALTNNGGSNAHVFHVTNTEAVINLSGVEIANNASGNWLISVSDDGWRGAGNKATLNADGQKLEGNIMVGQNSTLNINLENGSVFSGEIVDFVISNSGVALSDSVGTVNVSIDESSSWELTGDTEISSFSGDASRIKNNGYTLYVNGTALSGTANNIADEPSDWAAEEVAEAIGEGIVPVELQKNYKGIVNRGTAALMFVTLLEKSAGMSIDELMVEKGVEIDPSALPTTMDHNVLAANALGIIKGMGNGDFAASSPLTRAQITAILNRTAEVLGIDTSGYTHRFTDVAGRWMDSELGWAAENGIIEGRGNGIFDPDTAVTTEEAIAICHRAYAVLAAE